MIVGGKSSMTATSRLQNISQVEELTSASMGMAGSLQAALLASTALYLIPLLMQRIKVHVSTSSDSSKLFKVMWLGAFALNILTVSLPGRFDSEANRDKIDSEKKIDSKTLLYQTIFFSKGSKLISDKLF